MKKLLFIIIFLLIAEQQYAAFDETLQGARAMGLGGAFSAVENEGEGTIINPSTVNNIRQGSVTVLYSPLYLGLDDGSLSQGLFNAVYNFRSIGIFSLNYAFLKTETKAVSDLYNEDQIILTYHREISSGLFTGLKINYMKWQGAAQKDPFADEESLSSAVLSLGINGYYKKSRDFSLGLAVNNLNMPRLDDAGSGENDLERVPVEARLGLSFLITDILLALDTKFIRENIDIYLGGEYWFLNPAGEKFFAFRLGLNLPDLANGVNAAAGLSLFIIPDLSFDYGFLIPITTVSGIWGEHKFSLTLMF